MLREVAALSATHAKLLQLYGNVDGVLSNLVNKSSESSVRASIRLVKSYLQLLRNCELVCLKLPSEAKMSQLSGNLRDCSSDVVRAIGRICDRREWSELHALLSQFFDPNFKFEQRTECIAASR